MIVISYVTLIPHHHFIELDNQFFRKRIEHQNFSDGTLSHRDTAVRFIFTPSNGMNIDPLYVHQINSKSLLNF